MKTKTVKAKVLNHHRKPGGVFAIAGGAYILAVADYNGITGGVRVALISLRTGNPFRDPVGVKDEDKITDAEWTDIAGRGVNFIGNLEVSW